MLATDAFFYFKMFKNEICIFIISMFIFLCVYFLWSLKDLLFPDGLKESYQGAFSKLSSPRKVQPQPRRPKSVNVNGIFVCSHSSVDSTWICMANHLSLFSDMPRVLSGWYRSLALRICMSFRYC